MKFGALQKRKFGTANGSYSIITDTEYKDGQATFTDYEAELVQSHFGKHNFHVGPVEDNRPLCSKEFCLYPDGRKIRLNINHPRPEKNELRYYFSKKVGFKPEGGKIWFMYLKDGDIWIGSMSELSWRLESSVFRLDESDEAYQNSINDSDLIRISRLGERDQYHRDRRIAITRMEQSEFKCNFDPSHSLFESRLSYKPYLESHHLIPLGLQDSFSQPLDTFHNVFCLCTFCHRAVHHADESLARIILKNLALKSPVLEEFTLSIPDLLSYYAVEETV